MPARGSIVSWTKGDLAVPGSRVYVSLQVENAGDADGSLLFQIVSDAITIYETVLYPTYPCYKTKYLKVGDTWSIDCAFDMPKKDVEVKFQVYHAEEGQWILDEEKTETFLAPANLCEYIEDIGGVTNVDSVVIQQLILAYNGIIPFFFSVTTDEINASVYYYLGNLYGPAHYEYGDMYSGCSFAPTPTPASLLTENKRRKIQKTLKKPQHPLIKQK